ncbi:MAG TPA: aldo/keto reductase [Tepidisphaeraceae bacterium]|jgi:L-glyceraldehyde 3-phosphate reductase
MREFSATRYDTMQYRRCGRSGLMLPAISLGSWETFGGYRGEDVARECIFRAFDLGITHFDLANNYGTPPGNAEIVCGKIFREMPRDELIISSKAGFRMWPGPYGDNGSRKYLIASCDQSLKRLGVDYVDIFYHHRQDADTPVEETLEALDQLVRQGKALYAGLSNYDGAHFAEAVRVAERTGLTRITIHQPYYNMLGRTNEWDLFPQTQSAGVGCIAFCPLASGLLTDKYLGEAIPDKSRAAERWGKNWLTGALTPEKREMLIGLNTLAKHRGQTLAQMALAWILRLPAITSALIGASSAGQIEENVAALKNLAFSEEELKRIDQLTKPMP